MKHIFLIATIFIPLISIGQTYFSNISIGTRNAAEIQVTIDDHEINSQAMPFVRITNLYPGYHQLSVLVIASDGKMGYFKSQLLVESNVENTYILDMLSGNSFNFYSVVRQSLTPYSTGITQKVNNNTSVYYSEQNLVNYYQNNVPTFDMLKLDATPIKEVSYTQIATDSIISIFCNLINNKRFDEDKLIMAKLCLSSYALNTLQFNKILALFEFDVTKLQFIRNTIHHVYDKQNLFTLTNQFKSSNSLLVYQKFIQQAVR